MKPQDQNHSWKFFTSSVQAWDSMIESISLASESIELEQFILNYDSVGIRFLDALKERAKAGVRVKIFCDTLGSLSLYRSGVVTSLLTSGIEVKFFNSIIPWSPDIESLWYFRDHKKLLIIDKKVSFAGSVCLGDEMREWRESTVMISGPVVDQMVRSFYVMWNKSYHKYKFYFIRKRQGNPNALDQDFNYVTNSPLPGKRYMYRELLRAIKSSKKYIYLTTPYLLPDSKLLRAITRSSKRGVDIRLLVPEKTDSILVNIGIGTFFNHLLESGVRIYRYSSTMIHSKTGIVDGTWSTIGSLNLDNLSLRYNFEGNIVSNNLDFSNELEKQFLEDLNMSKEIMKMDWDKRGLILRFLELLVWPIRRFL
jgi:cardiolipin synthase A/B